MAARRRAAPGLPTNKWRGRDYRHVNLDLFESDLHAAITSHDDNISDDVDNLLQQFKQSVSATLDIRALKVNVKLVTIAAFWSKGNVAEW